jgi:hypothetical protein
MAIAAKVAARLGGNNMQTEMITALIGASGTLLAAVLGAYATIRTHQGPDGGAPALRKRRYGTIILGAGVLFAAASLVAGFAFGASHERQRAGAERKIKVTKLASTYQSLIDLGIGAGKPYIIPASLMLINLDKGRDNKLIDSARKMVYSLQLLSDLRPDAPRFTEGYHSNYNVDRTPGADPEREIETIPDSKSWDVLFSGNAGDRHLVVTGVHVQVPMRLSPNHNYHMFKGLGQFEDAFCYPNNDGDIMEELVIVVESGTLRLSLPGGGVDDAILQHGNENRPVEAKAYQTIQNGHTHDVLVARFHTIAKGDVAGMRVRWQP